MTWDGIERRKNGGQGRRNPEMFCSAHSGICIRLKTLSMLVKIILTAAVTGPIIIIGVLISLLKF